MTKRKYIMVHPRSKLAAALAENDWADGTIIEIVGGLLAPSNKCSNLYKALRRAKFGKYVVGGHRRRGTEGHWIAVA